MVRAGVRLPAPMQLMGHAQIQTTMIYVQVTPLEVYQQYARAVAQPSGHIGNAVMRLSGYAPLEPPLAHQFQRAIESSLPPSLQNPPLSTVARRATS